MWCLTLYILFSASFFPQYHHLIYDIFVLLFFCLFPLEYEKNNAWGMAWTQYTFVAFNELISRSQKSYSRIVRICLFFNIEEWGAVICDTSVSELNFILLK